MKTRKAKPILFSTPMVQKILAGKKTETRRVIKQKYVDDALSSPARKSNPDIPDEKFVWCLCDAPYEPGDILWVREAWRLVDFEYVDGDLNASVEYRADGEKGMRVHGLTVDERIGWRPSIFMPREAARIFLRVMDVRAERLQEISGADVLAEGVDNGASNPTMGKRWENMQRMAFADLWDGINARRDGGAYAWEKNPWVWAVEFERVEGSHE